MRIAIAGGTGVVGRYTVDAAKAAGHETVVLARSTGVDLMTGSGLEQAFEGVDAVIDASNRTTHSGAEAIEFFQTATENLLAAEKRAGVGHHVVLSIVGIDRIDWGYYHGKVRQEQVALAGPIPVSILRATQFHEFAGQMLSGSKGPIAVLPKMRMQPVAASEVGKALVDLASGPAVGMAPELAGPREESLTEVARKMQHALRKRRWIIGVRLPGAAFKAMAAGANLPAKPGLRGALTFDQWLVRATRDGSLPGATSA